MRTLIVSLWALFIVNASAQIVIPGRGGGGPTNGITSGEATTIAQAQSRAILVLSNYPGQILSQGAANTNHASALVTAATNASQAASRSEMLSASNVLRADIGSGGGGGSSVFFNVTDFGAVGDGTTDDTTAITNAIYAASTNGGTVFFPPGSYVVTSQLFLPNDGTGQPRQKTIRLLGSGAGKAGRFQYAPPPLGATILDLRVTNSTAKILTLGSGALEFDGIQLTDTTDGTTPFILTTGTTLDIQRCSFIGKTTNSTTQDAIVLGGTNTTYGGSTTNEAFQGYGSVISGNYFQNVQRAAWLRTHANGVQIVNNTIWQNAGGLCAIHIQGADAANFTAGNYIAGNLIEIPHYSYGVILTNARNNFFVGNQFWDGSAAVNLAIWKVDDSTNNVFISGIEYTPPSQRAGNSLDANQWLFSPASFSDRLNLNGTLAVNLADIQQWNNSTGDYAWTTYRSRGNKVSPTDPNAGDVVGAFDFYAYIAGISDYRRSARITAVSDDRGGYNTSRGHLEFATTGDALWSQAVTERMRILASGEVVFRATNLIIKATDGSGYFNLAVTPAGSLVITTNATAP